MDQLRAADSDLGIASNAVDALTRRIRAGTGSPQDVSDLATATSALNTARANLNALLASALNAAASGLGENTLAALATHRDHINGIAGDSGVGGIDTHYLFTARTEPQWVALRDALSNLRITARLDQDPSPDAQSLVSAADAEPATAAALAHLNANLSAVTAAWNAAVYPQ